MQYVSHYVFEVRKGMQASQKLTAECIRLPEIPYSKLRKVELNLVSRLKKNYSAFECLSLL